MIRLRIHLPWKLCTTDSVRGWGTACLLCCCLLWPLAGVSAETLSFDSAGDFENNWTQTAGDASNYWTEAALVGVGESRAIVRAGSGTGLTTVVRDAQVGTWDSDGMEFSLRFDYDSNITGEGGEPLFFGITNNSAYAGGETGLAADDFVGVILSQRVTGSNECQLVVVNGVDGYYEVMADSAFENLSATFYEIVLSITDEGTGFVITAVLNSYSSQGAFLVDSELITAEVTDLENTGVEGASALYVYVGGEDSLNHGIEAWDELVLGEIGAVTAPAAPSSLASTMITQDAVGLSWSDNSNNESGFILERRVSGGVFATLAELSANVSSYTDASVAAGTSYDYRVKAVAASVSSDYSNILSLSTPALQVPTAPSAPSFVSVSSSSIQLSWVDQSDNEDSMVVHRSVDGGNFNSLVSLPAGSTGYSDSGLAEATEYAYYITADNAGGSSGSGGSASTTTLINEPSNLVVSSVDQNSIQVSWQDNSSAETGYEVQRRVSGGSFSSVQTVAANATSFTDTGLDADTVYYYRVRTVSSVINSNFTAEAIGTTSSEPIPAGPSALSASGIGLSSVALIWTDNAGNESGFVLERSSGAGYSAIATLPANSTSYADSGLAQATTYSYRLKAYNGSGDSSYSDVLNVSTETAAPSGLSVGSFSDASVSLVWTDNASGETGFELERQVNSGGWSLLSTLPAGTQAYTDSSVSASKVYDYRVRTVYAGANSAYSNTVQVTTSATPPPEAPTNLIVVDSDYQSVDLSWQDNANDESGFRIERAEDGGAFAWLVNVAANIESYTDDSVVSGSTYSYRCYAFNGQGDSDYSNESGVSIPVPPAPDAPTALSIASYTTDSLSLVWTDNADDEDGFSLERRTGTNSFTEFATLTPNITSYMDNGLVSGTEYSYRIKAFNAYGDSSYSNTATGSVDTLPPPNAPSGLVSSSVSHDSIGLAWTDNSSDEDSFVLERRTSEGAFAEIATLAADTVSYEDDGLSPLSGYVYRIKAVNAQGDSSYSSQLAVSTESPPGPEAPASISGVALYFASIRVSWSGSADADNYILEMKTGDGPYVGIVTADASDRTYTISGLTENTSYTFRILARNEWGDSGYTVSTPVKTPLPDVPDAPGNLTAEATSEVRIVLHWSDLSNDENGFRVERRVSGGAFIEVASLVNNSESWQDDGLAANTSYDYRVMAYNSGGNSAAASISGVRTPNYPPPDAPTSLSLVARDHESVQVTWTDNADNEGGYTLERRNGSAVFLQVAALPANSQAYTNTGLSPETAYTYRVLATSDHGSSAYSNELALTTSVAPAPEAPGSLVGAAQSAEVVSLSWSDLSDYETGFRVERAQGVGGDFITLAIVPANATTYQDTNATPLSTIRYRIIAYNDQGDSPPSNIVTVETPVGALPDAPVNLSANATDPEVVVLSWSDQSDNETGFRIERRAGGAFATLVEIAPDAEAYTDRTVVAASQYDYRVFAVNGSGDSGASNTASVTTPNEDPPASPSGLTSGAVTHIQVQLSWVDNADDESGYRIYRAVGSGAFEAIADVAANSNSYLATGLSPDTSYRFQLVAYSINGESDPSNLVTVNTSSAPIPVTPNSLTVHAVDPETVQLVWGDSSVYEDGFIIQRQTEGGDYSILVYVDADQTAYTDVSAIGSTFYNYRVASYNSSGTSDFSEAVSVETPAYDPLATPTNLSASQVAWNRIDLAWTNQADDAVFNIVERKTGTESFSLLATFSAGISSYSDTSVLPSREYTYRVKAVGEHVDSAFSDPLVVTSADPPAPNAPTGLVAATLSDSSIRLNWTDASDYEDAFRIERRLAEGSSDWSVVGSVNADVQAFVDRELKANTAYLYRVIASNGNGDSNASNTTSVSTSDMPLPKQPMGLVAALSDGNVVTLSWIDLADNESGYRIERSIDEGAWASLATIGSDEISYVDAAVEAGHRYGYRIFAFNVSGDSDSSNRTQVDYPKEVHLVAPSQLSAVSTKAGEVLVSWLDNSSGESAYRLERRLENGSWSVLASLPADTVAYTDTSGEANNTYEYRVWVESEDAEVVSSSTTSITINEATVPEVPKSLGSELNESMQVALSWIDDADDEDGYRVKRSVREAAYATLVELDADTMSYLDASPVAGATNSYLVVAFNEVGESPVSNVTAVFVPSQEKPAAPGELTAEVVDGALVRLNWNDLADNEDNYTVERKVDEGAWESLSILAADSTSYDDASVETAVEYTYRVAASNEYGQSMYSNEVTANLEKPGRIIGLATRSMVRTGNQILIGSFIIKGTEPKTVYVRGIGAGLSMDGKLADPELTLVRGSDVANPIAYNDNWKDDQYEEKLALRNVPKHDKDSMILTTVEPGVYSALLRGVDGGTGYGVVDIYEVNKEGSTKIINIATRALVGTGNDVLIGAFIIQGEPPRRVFVRVRGPSLPPSIGPLLEDPTVSLVRGSDVANPVAVNNDWTSNREEVEASRWTPTNDKESVIIATLEPGAYSAVVSGVDNTTGYAVVEIYDFPEE